MRGPAALARETEERATSEGGPYEKDSRCEESRLADKENFFFTGPQQVESVRFYPAREGAPMRAWWNAAPLMLCLILYPAQEAAGPAPVPVEQEPHHHLLLKNEYVMVLRVILAPGERSLYHTHSVDDVAVWLAPGNASNQKFGGPEGPPERRKVGYVSLRTLRENPLTHRVHNVGQETFDVLDVELLQRPDHPSQGIAGPVEGENPSARVYKWILAPGAATPVHTHERPYLIMAASEFPLKMSVPDGQSSTHEIQRGDFHWVDSKVTHSLSNAGKGTGQIVEIEMK